VGDDTATVVDDGSADGPAWLAFGRTILQGATDPVASLDQARARFGDALFTDLPFAALVTNLRLRRDEAEVLALVAASEASWPLQRTVGELHGDLARNRLSLGLLSVLFGPSHSGPLAVTPGSRLQHGAMVTVDTAGPWSDHLVVLHPSVVWALIGDTSTDPDLPVDATWVDDHDAAGRHDESDEPRADLVVVSGVDRMRRRTLGIEAALGHRFVCVSEPTTMSAWNAVVREATITGRGVVVEVGDAMSADAKRTIQRAAHLVWVISAPHAPAIHDLPDRPWREVEAPSGDATVAEWAAILGGVDPSHALSLDQLHNVARARDALGGDVDAAVRRLAAGKLEQVTRRIRPTRRWDDIILSPDRRELMMSIVERTRHSRQVYEDWGFQATPSSGVVALFSGPSGTGKTLAAEIIAGELGLDLFKLDLSAVVSKYIGETEKNLEVIFDAASAGNAVLFFDEADSLFGKRSEVKDARDRYANIEVSYLLQRLEAHDGLVVMATNFEKNIDDAFLRRIHVRIAFAVPGVEERVRIWQHSFPASAPLAGDVDIDWLAERFELTGGAIRNATLNAGFYAASRGEDITMETVVIGVAREYRKMGRLVTAKDFGNHHTLLDTP
jgi:AAA+ superfamily predicted ATPase